jgi:hypothetical protein
VAFAYYNRLSRAQQRIYQQSDRITQVQLSDCTQLQPLIVTLQDVLQQQDRARTRTCCQALLGGMSEQLRVPPLTINVRTVRPSNEWEELHGFYQPAEGRRRALITVWMRTAQRRQVVAFRTFLRTLLHEFCHHLDYELYRMEESFHTEGFYKRESSLLHQLLPA